MHIVMHIYSMEIHGVFGVESWSQWCGLYPRSDSLLLLSMHAQKHVQDAGSDRRETS